MTIVIWDNFALGNNLLRAHNRSYSDATSCWRGRAKVAVIQCRAAELLWWRQFTGATFPKSGTSQADSRWLDILAFEISILGRQVFCTCRASSVLSSSVARQSLQLMLYRNLFAERIYAVTEFKRFPNLAFILKNEILNMPPLYGRHILRLLRWNG